MAVTTMTDTPTDTMNDVTFNALPGRRAASGSDYTPSFEVIAPAASEDAMRRLAEVATAVAHAALPSEDEMTGIEAADSDDSLPPLVAGPALRVRMPTVDDHIGKGIRPGHFIKPDPHDARATQRRHILTELRTWLTGRAASDGRMASHSGMTEDEIRAAMAEGRGWPGGRLWLLLQTMDEDGIPLPGTPADTGDRIRLAGSWAATVCENWLRYREPVTWTAESLALGFVKEDRLSDGRTIAGLWPEPSDLDALRTAPPLPESDTEAEVHPFPPRNMDAYIDEIHLRLGRFLTGESTLEFKIRMPGWAWSSLILTVVGYFWIVAFLLGGARR
jgi:hypothetical protein